MNERNSVNTGGSKPRADLYAKLFDHGLGHALMVQVRNEQVLLGNLIKDKDRLSFEDSGIVKDLPVVKASRCWDVGLIGCIAALEGEVWESLSFLGVDLCALPADLSGSREKLLSSIEAHSGDSLNKFKGSIYRGFGALLEADFIPIVLPTPVLFDGGNVGLAVADFKYAATSLDVLGKVQEEVGLSIENRELLAVEELDLGDETFNNMFLKFKDGDVVET